MLSLVCDRITTYAKYEGCAPAILWQLYMFSHTLMTIVHATALHSVRPLVLVEMHSHAMGHIEE